MKKRLMVILSTVALLSLLVVGGTMAWFTSNPEPVVNAFTAGTVEIEVNEHGFSDITNWNPGDTTNKDVSVISNGSKKSYVRVSLTPEWHKEGYDLSSGNVDLILANNSDWVKQGDYYYYKHILNEGEETSLLLDEVEFIGAETSNDYQGAVLKISVKAEAVQASHEAYKDTWELTELPVGVKEWSAPVDPTPAPEEDDQ
ncbi:TasA family protein [Clostridiisalibacter paucivorans]|uniref:TasA family protein n=1 Tax=Clostridiisalibacter paucivorans TaxID=408753 RepID=UPI00047EBC35|nr:TasA family protein [Clostridiisalibacter paucivorans]